MHEEKRIRRDHEVFRHDQRPITGVFSPVWRNIFHDFTHSPFDYQYNPICGKIELNFMRCMEAYGGNRGFVECRDYVEDYRECTSYDKQAARVKALYTERKRQFMEGEREPRFSKPPRMGSHGGTEY